MAAALVALPLRGLAQDEPAAIEVSSEPASSIAYASVDADRAEHLRRKRRAFIATGSVLLVGGLTCVALAVPVALHGESFGSTWARGFGLGLGGFVATVTGIGLLGRTKGLKEEQQRLPAAVGPTFVGVRGRF